MIMSVTPSSQARAATGSIGNCGPSLARMPLTATPAMRRPMAPPSAEQQHRLRQHQREDAAVGEADGLEDGELRNALAHRLRHGVAGEENEREEHRGHDPAHDEPDVGELADEGGLKGVLALGLGLVIGVGGDHIDRPRDAVRVLRLRHAHDVPAGFAAAELGALSK